MALKIAMIVRCFSKNGGLELYAHKVIEGLLARGHSVTVFCQEHTSDFTHERLKVEPIELRPRKIGKAERLAHDLRAGDIILAERHRAFDIIHSQHYPCSFANVATFHNHTVMRWSEVGLAWERWVNDAKSAVVKAYKLRDDHDRLLCQNANALVFPAKVMQDDYRSHYGEQIAMKPCMVAYPGATLGSDSDQPINGTEKASASEPFTFLFVGRGFRRKGLDVTFAAMKKLVSRGKNVRLIIAGLSEKPIDTLRITANGLNGKVQYLGFRKDMHNVYAMAQAGVLPSRVEPFGMAPVQAAQFGLVPIVSRVSGVSEVLKHNENALIVENHLDSNELADVMQRLVDDPSLTQRLSQNARIAAKQINWDVTVESTLSAYEAVVNKSELARAVQ